MNWLISIQIFTLAVISSVLALSWELCGPSTNPVKLRELSLRKNGEVFYVSMKLNVTENLTEPIEASLRIKKKVPFFDQYIDVPCIDDIGSCDYRDICALTPYKDKPCPAIFVKNNLPCRCPILQNEYDVKELPVDLRRFADEIEGKYKFKLVLHKGGAELFCLKMKIQI